MIDLEQLFKIEDNINLVLIQDAFKRMLDTPTHRSITSKTPTGHLVHNGNLPSLIFAPRTSFTVFHCENLLRKPKKLFRFSKNLPKILNFLQVLNENHYLFLSKDFDRDAVNHSVKVFRKNIDEYTKYSEVKCTKTFFWCGNFNRRSLKTTKVFIAKYSMLQTNIGWKFSKNFEEKLLLLFVIRRSFTFLTNW